jgi:hypothetical protein
MIDNTKTEVKRLNIPELNEQQNRVLEKLGEILPGASKEEKSYYLGRMEGYMAAKEEASRKEEEKADDKKPG